MLLLLHALLGQQPGHQKTNIPLSIPIEFCNKASGCKAQATGGVLDQNWRWTHIAKDWHPNCYNGGPQPWNETICPDPATCAKNCAIDGIDDWVKDLGIFTDQKGKLNLSYVAPGTVGPGPEGESQPPGESLVGLAGSIELMDLTCADLAQVGSRVYLTADNDTEHYHMFKLLGMEFSFDVDVSHVPCGVVRPAGYRTRILNPRHSCCSANLRQGCGGAR